MHWWFASQICEFRVFLEFLLIGTLRQVTAGADGYIKVYETASTLELSKWQLQVHFSRFLKVYQGL